MGDRKMRMRLTLELEREWASQLSKEELADYIRHRLDTTLGFRGKVKRLSLAENHS